MTESLYIVFWEYPAQYTFNSNIIGQDSAAPVQRKVWYSPWLWIQLLLWPLTPSPSQLPSAAPPGSCWGLQRNRSSSAPCEAFVASGGKRTGKKKTMRMYFKCYATDIQMDTHKTCYFLNPSTVPTVLEKGWGRMNPLLQAGVQHQQVEINSSGWSRVTGNKYTASQILTFRFTATQITHRSCGNSDAIILLCFK